MAKDLIKNLSSRIFLCFLIFTSADVFAQSTLTLTASKVYPSTYHDANDTLDNLFTFRISEVIPVTAGNAGKGTVTFSFNYKTKGVVNLTYKASVSGDSYIFHAALGSGLKSGDTVTTDYFSLRVNDGDPLYSSTVVSLALPGVIIAKNQVMAPYPRILRVEWQPAIPCPNPIPLCSTTNIINVADGYSGQGNQINPAISCLRAGDLNGVWYSFTAAINGNLNFTITPAVASDDYDWAVYDFTNGSCGAISTNPAMELQCNYDQTPGPTGPNMGMGSQFTNIVPIVAGNQYRIFISYFNDANIFTGTGHGFSLNLNASTPGLIQPVAVTPSSPAAICKGDNVQLTASGNATYTWSPATGLNTTTGATVIAAPTSTTTYTVTGISGCSTTVTVTVLSPFIAATGPYGSNICPGGSTTLKLNNADPSIQTYKWLKNGVFIAGATGSSYSATTAGIYSLQVKQGTTTCTSNTITVAILPSAQVTPSVSTICQGNSVTLTTTGASSYDWFPTSWLTFNATGAIASPPSTITYTVRATGSPCPAATATINVLSPQISGPSEICSGESATLKLNNADPSKQSYQWQKDGADITGSKSSSYSATTAGSYKLKVTQGGITCTSNTITVTVIPTPVISASTVTPCEGDNVTLTAPAGDSWQWYNSLGKLTGKTGQTYTFAATSSDNYYVVVSSGTASCTSSTKSITVTPAACCVPTNPVTPVLNPDPNIPLGDPNTVTTINAGGGTVIFNGAYHVRGSLILTNGDFFLLPGTVFTIDQTATTYANSYIGSYILVLDATLYLQSAKLLPAAGPLATTVWGGLILQRSTIFTGNCNGTNSVIQNGFFGIQIIADGLLPISDNTCHYYISNTDFLDNEWIGIWDIAKASVLPGEGITNCNFINTFWYNQAIYFAEWSPLATQTLEVKNNYIENFGNAIVSDYDYAVIEDNRFRRVAQGIDINSAAHTSTKNIIKNNTIELDPLWSDNVGISDPGFGDISGNIITGTGNSGETGIEFRNSPGNVSTVVRNNTILNTAAGIRNKTNFSINNSFDYNSNTLTNNKAAVSIETGAFTPPEQFSVRCNTIDNSTLSGTSYGIFVDQNGYSNTLGNSTSPNGNAFKGFKGVLNRFPVEYRGPGGGTFHYYKSTSQYENFVQVTNGGPTIPGGAVPSSAAPGCFPGSGVGFRLAVSGPLSAQDSVNAAMDSLRFQLGDFRKMKIWQGEILSYFEKNNNLDGIHSYTDSLKTCNLEAYNTFMLYLMNRYDIMNQCSKAHQCADEVLDANPDDAEILARTAYFNYECRKRHGGGSVHFILPFMPMNPQDSIDLTYVANSGTSLSQTACRLLRRHNPKIVCNAQNTYTPNYPDCGLDCKKKKNEFLKKGWEKQTGFNADKQSGQLSQNIPNPAENETVIPYLIPSDNFESAYISIQSVANGIEVKRIELTQAGYGGVAVNLENLSNGVYTYTLVLDGIKQNVKRMVVMK